MKSTITLSLAILLVFSACNGGGNDVHPGTDSATNSTLDNPASEPKSDSANASLDTSKKDSANLKDTTIK